MTSKKKKIYKAINKRLREIDESYEKYQHNPYIPDHVHRFRVDMRKLRAVLNFLKPVIQPSYYNVINQSLRDIGKLLSPLRDLDTLIDECTEVAYKKPKLVENYTIVFQFLHKERLELIDELSQVNFLKEIDDRLMTVKNTMAKIKLKEKVLTTFIDERFDHKVQKLKKQYKKLDKLEYDHVHEVRKQAKKVRYTVSELKKALPKKEGRKVKKQAKIIQRKLGELTDTYVIVELLDEYKGKTANNKLETSFETLIDYYSHDRI